MSVKQCPCGGLHERGRYSTCLPAVEADDKARKEKRNKARRERDQMMRDLGLTKVRGAVSGRVYWE